MEIVFNYIKKEYNNNLFEQKLFILYHFVSKYNKNPKNLNKDFFYTFISIYRELFDLFCYTKITLDTKHKIMIINIMRKIISITQCCNNNIKLNINNITSILTNEYINYIYNLYSK